MPNAVLKPWSQTYSVGVDQLDDDHRKLLEMINRLHQAMSTGQSKDMIVPLIKDLKSYTITHFKNEENYMEKIGHPGLMEQRKQHAIFINKIQEFETELNKGQMTLAIKVMPFLNDWLLMHIMDKDKKYATN